MADDLHSLARKLRALAATVTDHEVTAEAAAEAIERLADEAMALANREPTDAPQPGEAG